MIHLSGPTAIVALTTYPAVVPTDPSIAASVFDMSGGNACEILGKVSAGSGKLYLLRSLGPTSTEWYPVDDDSQDLKSLQVDSSKPTAIAGYFSGVWMTGNLELGGSGQYLVFSDGGATLSKLYAAPRRI